MLMKSLLYIAAFLFCLSASQTSYCQNFKVPDRYSFESIDAYHRYDKDIIKCIKWLEKIPPGDESPNVKKATRFLMEWQTGCPYIKFSPNVRIDAFLGDSPEYRIYYLGGWIKYALENPDKADKMMCTYSGIKTVIKVYKENREAKRDGNLDDLVKLDEQSKLRVWVQEKLR